MYIIFTMLVHAPQLRFDSCYVLYTFYGVCSMLCSFCYALRWKGTKVVVDNEGVPHTKLIAFFLNHIMQ